MFLQSQIIQLDDGNRFIDSEKALNYLQITPESIHRLTTLVGKIKLKDLLLIQNNPKNLLYLFMI